MRVTVTLQGEDKPRGVYDDVVKMGVDGELTYITTATGKKFYHITDIIETLTTDEPVEPVELVVEP